MKKYLSVKKIIIFVIIVGIGYSIYSYYFSSNTKTVTITKEYKVSTGSIENSIKITGKAAIVDEQTLKFNQVGKVAKLYFKNGDSVKKGQLIAELNKEDINSTIKQAELSLSDAKIKLADLLNGPQYKDILNGENNVKTAENKILTLQNDLSILQNNTIPQYQDKYQNDMRDFDNQITLKENAIKNNENDIKNSELKLINLKNDLVALEKTEEKGLTDYNVDLNKTLNDAYINAKKQLIDLENYLYNTDQILGVSDMNKNKNDSFEMYIGSKNSFIKIQTENDWRDTNILFLEIKEEYNKLPTNIQDSEKIITFLNKLLSCYDKAINLGKDGQEMMNNSIISSSFSQSDIDSKTSVFSSVTNSSQSGYSTIKTTITTIQKLTDPELKKTLSENAINSKKQSIADAELALNKIKIDNTIQYQNDLNKLKSDKEYATKTYESQMKNYESQITQKNLDIESAKNSLNYTKESLKIIKAGATTVELSQARNNVTKQQLSLENARKGLDKYELVAPFDGTIRKIDFKVGDNLIADEQKYIYVENPNLVKISATLDQLDIVKVSIGQEAKIVFDSYPDKEFIGKINEKDSTPAVTSGVTSYSITITLDKGKTDIFSSMTAKVSIIIESKKIF
ncbi:biotin/lipoyl-binding protein [Candidatus Gracilibacteria bacterium]|nr:biotin/lipoyl-binding protein [Candidatus Gracilibacteria bacterium]